MSPRPTERTERADPRTLRSRERVLTSAVELLREHGAAGCTIEAVAAHSGVAKTTIYRQFDDREDLVVAAIESVKTQPFVPVDGGVLADLETMAQELAVALRTGEFASLLGSLIELAERSPRAAALVEEFAQRRRRHLVDRLQVAIGSGELRADEDLDLLVSRLVGPLFYRRFVSRQASPASFVSRLVRETVGPLLVERPDSGSAGGGRPRSAR